MALLPPWFSSFCAPGADRFEILTGVLRDRGVPFTVLNLAGHRHIQAAAGRPVRPQPGEKILLAHYDRFPGSPGGNDNGSSVWHLVEYLAKSRKKGKPLRVVFTDGEELYDGKKGTAQGSYPLGLLWASVPGIFPVVLDMTGVGDTFVLGHAALELAQVNQGIEPQILEELNLRRLWARRILAATGAGDYVEIDTPFSDDLGLLLAGVGAVQVSLLPRKQALAYRKSRLGNLQERGLPPAWSTMHSGSDTPDRLEEKTAALVGQFLEKLEEMPLSIGT